jgi:hypothetical protein
MVVVSTAVPSLRHRPRPTLVLHAALRVPSGTTSQVQTISGSGFLVGCCFLVVSRAFRESKTAARLLQQRQDHCGTSSMVMVWYASCMAPSASSRFPLPVSAPSFVSFRFVALHGCSVCSPSSDTHCFPSWRTWIVWRLPDSAEPGSAVIDGA